MGKNVAVFVDVANIFYAAKAAGVDIDYVTLLKASSAGRDLVRAYAYTGLDPDNENQRNFHDFLRRHGYRVVSKDIRKYGDGKVKANLDIELVVDMMKTARNLDVAIVVSGDGDFAPAIRAVQEQGVRVEVVSFRGNTSSDLMDVADQFTDITQIAKVEKGSSRSGRRVADDDADLSMTAVPEKQSEGTGERARGRGRTRRTTAVTPTRGRSRPAAVAAEAGDGQLVVLPGEKLSRASSAPAGAEPEDGDLEEVATLESGEVVAAERGAAERGAEEGLDDGRRRRRRRGGRGRGRGRGREEGAFAEADETADRMPVSSSDVDEDVEPDEAPAPARRPASSFGSVWDSQIGISASRGAPVVDEDDDLDEPAVPEYLIAERRQRDGGRGGARGGRGRGGAYAAALDRERFGGGRGSTLSRFQEPAPRREGAFGRPERSDRGGGVERTPFRPAPRPAPRGSGDEPWSEVPPEIEAMLRAQLGSRPAAGPRRETPAPAPDAAAQTADEPAEVTARTPARRSSRRTTATIVEAADVAADAVGAGGPEPAPPARRTTTRRPRATASGADAMESPAEEAAPKKATTRRSSTTRTGSQTTSKAAAEGSTASAAAPDEPAAPKRRATRKKAEPAA